MFYSEIAKFKQVYSQVYEGKVQVALQNLKDLEKRNTTTTKEILEFKLVKANVFRLIGRYMEAIEICEFIYPKFQEMEDLLPLLDILLIQTYSYMIMADVYNSVKLIKQAKNLLKSINDKFSIVLKGRESLLLRIEAGISFFKGEIQKFLDLNKKAYELAKETRDKGLISASLSNIAQAYMQMKKLDKALEYAKAAVKIDHRNTLPNSLVTLIEVYINRGEINQAKISLDNFRRYIEKRNTANDRPRYIYSKALILKSSLRAKNRVRSEELFRRLALDDKCIAEYRIDAIINLCDLYLTELQITNDLEIIYEIQPFIQELLNIAQRQHSYLILAETYLLLGKMSLLTSNIKEAQKMLIQAQKLSETYGLEMLAMKISSEHDVLLRHTKMLKNLNTSELSLSERLEFTGLKKQVDNMVKGRMIDVQEFSEEEPVLLLILSEGGIPYFKKSFIEDKFTEEHLLGGFISSINTFIKSVFSEGLDRASFGNYILIMKSITPFLVCYVFKGDSYNAIQRVKLLISKIKYNEDLWQKLQHFYQMNRIVQKDDIPYFESIIKKIFLEKYNTSNL